MKRSGVGVLATEATDFINFGLSQENGTSLFPITRSLEGIPTKILACIEDILCITEGDDDGRFRIR